MFLRNAKKIANTNKIAEEKNSDNQAENNAQSPVFVGTGRQHNRDCPHCFRKFDFLKDSIESNGKTICPDYGQIV